MGAPLCVWAPQRWVRRVVGMGLVSVSTVWLAAVCRVSSSAALHGGLLWWCLGGGLGLCGSWEGAGHAGSGWLGGGGARVWACVFAFCSPRGPFLCLSLTPLFSLACLALFFLGGGGGGLAGVLCVAVGVCRCRHRCGRGCRGGRGSGGCCALGFCVCAGPQASGSQGAGPGGADGGWLAAVVAWRLRGWPLLLVSAWVAWPGVGARVGVFMAWADWVVGSVGVVGLCGCRVCVRRRRSGLGWGTVGDAMGGGDAGDAYGGVL